MKKYSPAQINSLGLARARKQEADRITWRNTLYSTGVALLPFPLADAVILMALQVEMLRDIARLYEVEFKENLTVSLIGTLAGFAGTAALIKAIPGLGYLLGGAAAVATAGAGTYATGKVFTHHFSQGGTLLDFDPVKSREFFQREFEAGQRLVSDEINEVKETAGKERKVLFGGLLSGKKQQREETERQELKQIQEELRAAVAELKGLI